MLIVGKKKEVSLDELLAEVWKTLEQGGSMEEKALIKVNPKTVALQQQDMKTIEQLIGGIKNATDHDSLYTQAAIAVGYANAMQAHEVITEDELKRLNAMIGTIAERRLTEVQRIERRRFFKMLLHFGKVGA